MTESPRVGTPLNMPKHKPDHPVRQVSSEPRPPVRQAEPLSTSHRQPENSKPATVTIREPFSDALSAVRGKPGIHAGLYYLRGLTSHDASGDTHPYANFVNEVAKLPVPSAYAVAYKRWIGLLSTHPSAVEFTAKTQSSVAIGLGAMSPIEVGFTLHHTYGVPYLPGSALKGLARRSAVKFDLPDPDIEILFGDDSESGSTSAGYITFWDGWLIPSTQHPLQRDVITVHHPEYYTSGNTLLRSKDSPVPPIPPTDFDDPNPIPFLSIPQEASFKIVLTCQAESGEDDRARQWAQTAATILQYGLTTLGLGAKTNSGYGIFNVDPDLTKELK